jgi:catechol 2,3-dioxygenase-like lactoylglutathione lyase family enzyme
MNRILRVTPRLPVAELQAAVDFYRDHFGFEGGDLYPVDKPTFALLALGEVTLQFFVPDATAALPSRTAAPNDRAMLSLDVTDARALHARLVKKGVAVEWGPEVYWYGRREFAIRDPNGYLVILSEATDDPVTDRS